MVAGASFVELFQKLLLRKNQKHNPKYQNPNSVSACACFIGPEQVAILLCFLLS
jgi:hypothetical protein